MLNLKAMRIFALAVSGLAAALTGALAADERPGSRPGDDALTCDQIYAQASAESQRDQQERSKRNEQRKAEAGGMAALATTALLAGGLGGTAQAANRAAEGMANKTVAELGAAPQTNPRLDHLKGLWAAKHCAAPAAKAPGAHSEAGDAAMDCAQIAAELAPYAQQMKPNIATVGQSAQQINERELQRGVERRKEHEALGAAAAATRFDPTGLLGRAFGAVMTQQAAKERREDETEKQAIAPMVQQANAQTAQLAAQGQRMQSNERVQTLLALAQRKGCTQSPK